MNRVFASLGMFVLYTIMTQVGLHLLNVPVNGNSLEFIVGLLIIQSGGAFAYWWIARK